ncbi:MAG: LuxR C-terminal-related transcriptional regulator [Actinomycetota bacterium]|nr:LuxR C-terminal-related transcriptional regulator [Actinomycetota bacterium]
MECARLDRSLADAKRGLSSAVMIRGEPGVGKTALFEYALERAGGMVVTATRAIESESEIAFAGLSDLLRPFLTLIPFLPGPQSDALSGALQLGPPRPGDPFAIYAATLGMFALAAEKKPVLVGVDDAHWLDTPSQQALLFVARRLRSEGVAMVLTMRPWQESPLNNGDVSELPVTGLDGPSSTQLLARHTRHEISPTVAESLFLATRGNPLALIECSTSLSSDQLRGAEGLHDPLPIGAHLEDAFSRLVNHLSPESRRAVLILAASERAEGGFISRALAAAGIPSGALTEAEAAGVVLIQGSHVRFRHPLVRSAVYHGATPEEHRLAHRLLAEACTDPWDLERRAWHLAAATLLPDEQVGSVLEEAALSARHRSAHGAAAATFEKAAGLSPLSDRRATRLLEAAREWQLAGSPERAVKALDEATNLTEDPLVHADIQHVRGQVHTWSGPVMLARDLLTAEAARVEAIDPQRAALLAVEAVGPTMMTGDLGSTLASARRAYGLATRIGGPTKHIASLMLVEALTASSDHQGAKTLLKHEERFLNDGSPLSVGPLSVALGEALMWLEQYERAANLVTRVITRAREGPSPTLLPLGLAILSQIELRTDKWTAAYANASEGVVLAHDTGQENQAGYNVVCLGRVEAALGREQDCRIHIAQSAQIEKQFGAAVLRLHYGAALGFLELSMGRLEAAVHALEPVAHFVENGGPSEPGISQWPPDLIEAYIRLGRLSDAQHLLEPFEKQAEATETVWAKATSARCRGLIDEASCEEHFSRALDLHAQHPSTFERARTELCFGERLRRKGKKRLAQRALASASEVFERLGALPWADKARDELRALGAATRRRTTPAARTLTAQEVRVAQIVGQGATNKEAAAQLFLSPKTIEVHLGHIYAKLGVRSRTELAALILGSGAISA